MDWDIKITIVFIPNSQCWKYCIKFTKQQVSHNTVVTIECCILSFLNSIITKNYEWFIGYKFLFQQ
jgi:hypothetical protein